MFPFSQPDAIGQLRAMAKLGYIRAQLVAQWIMERTGTTEVPPDWQIRVLNNGIAAEATRFYSELSPFSVPSNELVLRCFLKLVWEFHQKTFERSTLWVPRGWIEIETLVLSMQYRNDVPVTESRETMIAKVLTQLIAEALKLSADVNALTWVYSYVAGSVLVSKDNLAYTDAIQKVDWQKAKLVKFAIAL
jgi:hypothetical protein